MARKVPFAAPEDDCRALEDVTEHTNLEDG